MNTEPRVTVDTAASSGVARQGLEPPKEFPTPLQPSSEEAATSPKDQESQRDRFMAQHETETASEAVAPQGKRKRRISISGLKDGVPAEVNDKLTEDSAKRTANLWRRIARPVNQGPATHVSNTYAGSIMQVYEELKVAKDIQTAPNPMGLEIEPEISCSSAFMRE